MRNPVQLLIVNRTPGDAARATRTGQVTADRRAFRDDQGQFNVLSASFFWAVWGMKFDRARTLQNMEWLADHGFHDFRCFLDVDGGSWADRPVRADWPDFVQQVQETANAAYHTYGLRMSPTLIAGGTGIDPVVVARKTIEAYDGRQQLMVTAEAANEDNCPDDKLRQIVPMLRSAFPGLTVMARSAPMPDVNGYLDLANGLSIHTDRTPPAERQIRQAWDAHDVRVPGSHNEPPGPGASIATMTDPTQLAQLAAVGILCGLGKFVFHCGPGKRGGGAYDAHAGFGANFWDSPGIEDQVKAVRQAMAVMPPDVVNWTKHNTSSAWPNHPMRPDAIVDEDGNTHGCNRSYGATTGGEFVTCPTRVVQYVDLIAKQRCLARAYANGELVKEETVGAGQAFHLEGPERGGAWAYIVRGQYT